MIEIADLGDSGLAHANGADGIGFDEPDADLLAQSFGEHRCCHPSRRAPANDGDGADGVIRARMMMRRWGRPVTAVHKGLAPIIWAAMEGGAACRQPHPPSPS
ncbi:hypothetical protein JCM17846_08310 [Iodidimonas nitroreducens]|uniref:Uncharacterized protein n=1 Tax=Iodidimonas nitroreducens TaxID=1236968 RepID=A0A5A7N7V2_9PROT|nr:hypothetical protein JCM17846_08310 [Iodidimonas nitroreducens]